MPKPLSERPNLDHLREQAKDLLRDFRRGDEAAVLRFREGLPAFQAGLDAKLHDAQSVVAREYGFPSWIKLTAAVETKLANLAVMADAARVLTLAAFTDELPRFKEALTRQPGLTKLEAATALAWGEVEYVRNWAKSADLNLNFGPKGWKALEYVCYSRVQQVFPERSEGLVECARLLLDQGADPNTSHDHDGAPLSVLYGAAGESGHVAIVRLLLERGANPDDGESVPHAAEYDRREVLDALLEHGANISGVQEGWGNTPLFFLMGYRKTDLNSATAMRGCEWLLEHGADPNIVCGSNRETALHAAIRCGQGFDTIDMLLRFGADPRLKTSQGWDAVELAAMIGNNEASQALALHGFAAELDQKRQFLASVSSGIVPADRSQMGELTDHEKSLIVKLAELGNLSGVQAALDTGFELDARGECGATALHFASYCGHADVVSLLVERGAPVDLREPTFSATPFGWATHGSVNNRNPGGDYPRVVQLLLSHGSSVADAEEALGDPNLPEDVRVAIVEGLPKEEE